jgi:hypothetical protein
MRRELELALSALIFVLALSMGILAWTHMAEMGPRLRIAIPIIAALTIALIALSLVLRL